MVCDSGLATWCFADPGLEPFAEFTLERSEGIEGELREGLIMTTLPIRSF
jgi:hypothetical protein